MLRNALSFSLLTSRTFLGNSQAHRPWTLILVTGPSTQLSYHVPPMAALSHGIVVTYLFVSLPRHFPRDRNLFFFFFKPMFPQCLEILNLFNPFHFFKKEKTMDSVSQFSEVSSEACLRGINKGIPPDGFDQTNPLRFLAPGTSSSLILMGQTRLVKRDPVYSCSMNPISFLQGYGLSRQQPPSCAGSLHSNPQTPNFLENF